MVNFISKPPSLVEYIFLCPPPLKAIDILQVSFFNVDHHHHKTKACSSLPLVRNKWTKETLKYRSSPARATDSSRVTMPYSRFSFRIFIIINHKISFSYYAIERVLLWRQFFKRNPSQSDREQGFFMESAQDAVF